jgi:hypothetical protein
MDERSKTSPARQQPWVTWTSRTCHDSAGGKDGMSHMQIEEAERWETGVCPGGCRGIGLVRSGAFRSRQAVS